MTEYTIADGDKVEKYHVAILFNSGTSASPSWVQLAKSTENTITMNAETEDLDFIVDKNPTTVIKRYKPQFTNNLILYKGSPDYEFFWPKFYSMPTGADANGEILIVFLNEKNESDKYEAWKGSATYVLDNLDPANSTLSLTVNINGTIIAGTVEIASGVPTFTPAA